MGLLVAGNNPAAVKTAERNIFTATAGQTTFTITQGYQAGDIDVFLNGVRLVDTEDYVANNGTTVVLNIAAAVGDSVVVVCFRPFQVADFYTKSEQDTRYVNAGGDTVGILQIQNPTETGYASTLAESVTKSTLAIKTHSTDSTLTTFGAMNGGDAYIQRSNGPGSGSYNLRLNPFGGAVLAPNQPAFRVVGNTSGWVTYGLNGTYFVPVGSAGQASQTTSVDGSKAGFNLNDTGTRLLNRGGHMNLATGTFTAPIAGLYHFAASALLKSSTYSSTAYMNLKFFVNGTEVSQPNGQYFYLQNMSNGAECAASESVVLNLSTNDQVQCRIRRANDAANTYQCYADLYHFEGYLIG